MLEPLAARAKETWEETRRDTQRSTPNGSRRSSASKPSARRRNRSGSAPVVVTRAGPSPTLPMEGKIDDYGKWGCPRPPQAVGNERRLRRHWSGGHPSDLARYRSGRRPRCAQRVRRVTLDVQQIWQELCFTENVIDRTGALSKPLVERWEDLSDGLASARPVDLRGLAIQLNLSSLCWLAAYRTRLRSKCWRLLPSG